MRRLATSIPDNPPPLLDGIPIVYEDDLLEELGMGEGSYHYDAGSIVYWALRSHLDLYHADLRTFANLNCYYLDSPLSPRTGRAPYVCPDVMVVRPLSPDRGPVNSYRIGKDGSAPLLAVEVLSHLSGKIRDPQEKPEIYARLGIQEYILIDELGKFLPQPLLLKRLREDRTWEEIVEEDGGVTSQLGIRLVHDGRLSVFDARTGWRYQDPVEMQRALRRLQEGSTSPEAGDSNGEDS